MRFDYRTGIPMNPPLDSPVVPHVERYRANLQSEVDSAALYRGLADAESNEAVAELYRRLAGVEENHAAFWQQKLADAGVHAEMPRPGWRTRMLVWLAHRVSADLVAGGSRSSVTRSSRCRTRRSRSSCSSKRRARR